NLPKKQDKSDNSSKDKTKQNGNDKSKATLPIYLFATGLFKFTRPLVSSPFILDSAPQGTSATNAQTVVITTPQPDRNYYRIGIGVDLSNVVSQWTGKKPTQ